jgi:hypothetical protein
VWDDEEALRDTDCRFVIRVLPSGMDASVVGEWDGWLSDIVRVLSSAEYVRSGLGSGLGIF